MSQVFFFTHALANFTSILYIEGAFITHTLKGKNINVSNVLMKITTTKAFDVCPLSQRQGAHVTE